ILTSRPAPLTGNRPLHVKTPGPGKSNPKSWSILQENAPPGSHAARVVHKVWLHTLLGDGSKEVQALKANLVTRPLGDETPFSNCQRRVL
ncbi:hypothetical protein BGW80DRAFT_1314525, partial [Lactifluus volemus]